MPKWVAQMWSFHRGVQLWGVSKNRGKTPKMDDDDNGNPYFLMDDLEGKPTIFGNTHLWISTQTWKSDGIFVSKKLLPCEQTRRNVLDRWSVWFTWKFEKLQCYGICKNNGFLCKTQRDFWHIADSDDQNALPAKNRFSSTTFCIRGLCKTNCEQQPVRGSSRRSTIHLYFKLNKLDKKQDEFLAVPHRMVGPCKTPLGPKHHSLEGAGRDTP